MKAEQLLKDFGNALSQLQQALTVDHLIDLEKAGCIHYFEFCFELAWKTVQATLAQMGLTEYHSPKSCFKQAFSMGWVTNEEHWLAMLETRNRMTHTYDCLRALETYQQLPQFLRALQQLHSSLSCIVQEK